MKEAELSILRHSGKLTNRRGVYSQIIEEFRMCDQQSARYCFYSWRFKSFLILVKARFCDVEINEIKCKHPVLARIPLKVAIYYG